VSGIHQNEIENEKKTTELVSLVRASIKV